MKKFIVIPILIVLFISANAQIKSVAGGLLFSSGIDFNTTSTGNPGFFGKVNIGLIKRMQLAPSMAVYKAGKGGDQFSGTERKNYMFQGDLDLKYRIMRDDNLTLVGFSGLNMTGIFSKVNEATTLINEFEINPGLNLGAAVEMNIDNTYEAVISGKYIVSEFSQFVISIGVLYHFERRSRRGW